MKDNYVAALLEDMNSKIDVIAEGVVGLDEKVTVLTERVDKIEEVVADIPVIKAVVQDISKKQNYDSKRIDDLELRTTRLERKIA